MANSTHFGFFGQESTIDTERITMLESDDPSEGLLPSSPLTTVFSKMYLRKPHRLQTLRSFGCLSSLNEVEKLEACRISTKRLQHQMSLDSFDDSSSQGNTESYTASSSSSDSSFDDEYICVHCCSSVNFGSKHDCQKEKDIDAESERLWGLFWSPKDDAPGQISKVENKPELHPRQPQKAKSSEYERLYLPSFHSDLEVPDYRTNSLPQTSKYDAPRTVRLVPQSTPPPRLPPPPPMALNHIPIPSNPPHNSWSIVTVPRPPTAIPQRSRSHTLPSNNRPPHPPSKLSTCMTNDYDYDIPPSIPAKDYLYSSHFAPTTPCYPYGTEDLMSKMQKSVFDFETHNEEEKEEDDSWLRRFHLSKKLVHKDPLVKAIEEFEKKKGKSFGGLGEVLRRSLRMRKSSDF